DYIRGNHTSIFQWVGQVSDLPDSLGPKSALMRTAPLPSRLRTRLPHTRASHRAAAVTEAVMPDGLRKWKLYPRSDERGYTAGMLSLLKVSAAASLVAVLAFSQSTPVVQLQNLAHTTQSLDKTLPFYRDVLGLPVNGTRDPLAQQPQKLDEDMSKFTATKGM